MAVKKLKKKTTGAGGRETRTTVSTAARANRGKTPVEKPQPIKREPRKRGGIDEATGFSKNSDQNTIAHELIKGGKDRKEITARVTKKLGNITSTGSERNTASQITSTVRALESRGFIVDSHYKLIPPDKIAKNKTK